MNPWWKYNLVAGQYEIIDLVDQQLYLPVGLPMTEIGLFIQGSVDKDTINVLSAGVPINSLLQQKAEPPLESGNWVTVASAVAGGPVRIGADVSRYDSAIYATVNDVQTLTYSYFQFWALAIKYLWVISQPGDLWNAGSVFSESRDGSIFPADGETRGMMPISMRPDIPLVIGMNFNGRNYAAEGQVWVGYYYPSCESSGRMMTMSFYFDNTAAGVDRFSEMTDFAINENGAEGVLWDKYATTTGNRKNYAPSQYAIRRDVNTVYSMGTVAGSATEAYEKLKSHGNVLVKTVPMQADNGSETSTSAKIVSEGAISNPFTEQTAAANEAVNVLSVGANYAKNE
jgi:hypothetical protein